ncbi:MAG: hypothetical protein U1E34_15015 [Amaricoccus sp.]
MTWLFSLPDFAWRGLAGMVGGGVGGALSWIVLRFGFKGLKGTRADVAISLFCLMLGVKVSVAAAENAWARHVPEIMISELSKQRLFAVIFEDDPGSRERLRQRLAQIMTAVPADQLVAQERMAATEFVGAYWVRQVPKAPDDAVYRYVRANADLLAQLSTLSPALCAALYFPAGSPDQAQLSVQALVVRGAEIKADLLDSAIRQPVVPRPPLSSKQLYDRLVGAYRDAGSDPADIDRLGQLERLPAEEGCRLTIGFNQALVALGPAGAADILGSLGQS